MPKYEITATFSDEYAYVRAANRFEAEDIALARFGLMSDECTIRKV